MTMTAKPKAGDVHIPPVFDSEPLAMYINHKDQKVYVKLENGYWPIETAPLDLTRTAWNEYENLKELRDIGQELENIRSMLLHWGCALGGMLSVLAITLGVHLAQ